MNIIINIALEDLCMGQSRKGQFCMNMIWPWKKIEIYS